MRKRQSRGNYIQAIITIFGVVGLLVSLVCMYIGCGCLGFYILFTSLKFMIANSWSTRYACAIGGFIFGFSIVCYFIYGLPTMIKFMLSFAKKEVKSDR
jgi:hypothetical protein